jgi:hypothetical protein
MVSTGPSPAGAVKVAMTSMKLALGPAAAARRFISSASRSKSITIVVELPQRHLLIQVLSHLADLRLGQPVDAQRAVASRIVVYRPAR